MKKACRMCDSSICLACDVLRELAHINRSHFSLCLTLLQVLPPENSSMFFPVLFFEFSHFLLTFLNKACFCFIYSPYVSVSLINTQLSGCLSFGYNWLSGIWVFESHTPRLNNVIALKDLHHSTGSGQLWLWSDKRPLSRLHSLGLLSMSEHRRLP